MYVSRTTLFLTTHFLWKLSTKSVLFKWELLNDFGFLKHLQCLYCLILSNLAHLLTYIWKKMTVPKYTVQLIRRDFDWIKNNVGTYDMFRCNVLRHTTTTHAAYKTTAPFMQRIKHCVLCIAISYMKTDVRDYMCCWNWFYSNTVLLEKSVLILSTPTRGSPVRAHQSS